MKQKLINEVLRLGKQLGVTREFSEEKLNDLDIQSLKTMIWLRKIDLNE